MANTIYGISKFLPGQVWFMEIDTEKIDGNWTKKRPYFIVAANTRRLVVLRMTHGGEGGTNWLYRIDIDEDKPNNIICDAPITVSVEKIRETAEYKWTFSQDMVMDILKYHFASIMYQSVSGILEGNGSNDILELINNHQDRNRAFGKYMVVFDGDENDETVEPNDIQETEVTAEDDTIIDPDDKIIDITPVPVPVSTPTESVETVEVKEKAHAEKTEWPEIEASDCFIFQAGFRTRDVEVIEDLTRVGIKNPKFAMAHLINTHKVSYVNNRYNVTLKSTLIDRKHPAKTWMKNIVSDCERLGVKNTALVWGKHYNYIWKLYDEYRASKLPNSITGVNMKGA